MARALMFQGTGSDVGKSVLVAAFCRLAKRRGFRVAPFKAQNMSNNAAVCPGGGEIGRAQALQALAAGVELDVDFNPVLLKPQTDRTSQVVVHGKVLKSMEAKEYFTQQHGLLGPVMESFERLTAAYDLVLVEGAGSPAEVNLRKRDIANMGFARRANVPVCLIGDIERGGVIASIVGTKAVLDPGDAQMIRSFLVNKFRGDPRLFDEGVVAIEDRTGWPCHGVIPWLPSVSRLPSEDTLASFDESRATGEALRVAAPMLSRIANFDDADPLRLEASVDFRWVKPGEHLPRDMDVVVLFGTKSTVGDLAFLRAQGWDHDILAHARSGGRVLGLCGGYQMLGRRVVDPEGTDGESGEVPGLGLLDVDTVMGVEKQVAEVAAECAQSALPVTGYEIHMGRTSGPDCARPMLRIHGQPEGARSASGQVEGTYVHGAFTSDAFRRSWLQRAGARPGDSFSYRASVEEALDELADGVESSVDVDALLDSAFPRWRNGS